MTGNQSFRYAPVCAVTTHGGAMGDARTCHTPAHVVMKHDVMKHDVMKHDAMKRDRSTCAAREWTPAATTRDGRKRCAQTFVAKMRLVRTRGGRTRHAPLRAVKMHDGSAGEGDVSTPAVRTHDALTRRRTRMEISPAAPLPKPRS
jgi:hypothetical protein